MTWQPPPGMTVEPLHARVDGPVDVALVTLAPGVVTKWEIHDDAAEHIRILSGCLYIDVDDGSAPPVDLSEVSGRVAHAIEAGERHRLVNPFRSAPAVFLVIMKPKVAP